MSLLIRNIKGTGKNQILLYILIILWGFSFIACSAKNMSSSLISEEPLMITDIDYSSYSDKSDLVVKGSGVLKYHVNPFNTLSPEEINIVFYDSEFAESALSALSGISDSTIKELKLKRDVKKKISTLTITLASKVECNIIPNRDQLKVELKKDISHLMAIKKKDVVTSDNENSDMQYEVVADSRGAEPATESSVILVSALEVDPVQTTALNEIDIDANYTGYTEIKTLSVDDALSNLKVTIAGKGELDDYTTLELTNPSRLILDVWNAKNSIEKKSILVASNSIENINISEHKNKVRFVFESKSETLPTYAMNVENNNIVIAFNDAGGSGATDDTMKESYKAVLDGLDFDKGRLMAEIIISSNNQISYEVKEGTTKKIVIEMEGVRVPKKLSRPLDTSQFNTNVSYIELIKSGNVVRLEISLKNEVPYNVVQSENKIIIKVDNPVEIVEKVKEEIIVQEIPADNSVIAQNDIEIEDAGSADVAIEPTAESSVGADEALVIASAPKVAVSNIIATTEGNDATLSSKGRLLKEIADTYKKIDELSIEKLRKKKFYSGQRLSMDFKSADIHNVLRIIAGVSGYNIVTSDSVAGKVTIHLVNVPWDQALDVILGVKDLGAVKRDNIIMVIPNAQIMATAERERSMLKKIKEEALAEIEKKKEAIDELEPLILKIVPINYGNAEELVDRVDTFLSKRGSVSVDKRTNSIIIKDIEENVVEAVALLHNLDSATPQVLIEARIVEVSTNFTRQLGVQWGGGYTAAPAYGNALPYNFPSTFGVTGGAGTGNYVVDLPASVGQTSGAAVGFNFGHIANTLSLDMRLSAMETSGEGKIVSSPRIVTLDNIEAVIQQGTVIPYETTSDEGTVTEFVDANLSLTVTPHITADGSIKMKIKASKNAPNMSIVSDGQPAIDKKEATTEVLIKDGETTVIGGIFVIDEAEAVGGVPFFSKLPFIGWMFKTESKTKNRNELLIFITPRIIQPGEKVSL